MAWTAVVFLLVTPIVVVTFNRAVRDQEAPILGARWMLAQSPLILSIVAVIVDRSPQFLIVLAQVEAIALMIFALRQAGRGEGVA